MKWQNGYSQALVSYIDLLGFKDLIDQHGENAEAVRSILTLAREEFSVRRAIGTRIKSVGKKNFRAVSFSDLIVRCTTPELPSRAEELVVNEIVHLGEKQLALLLRHMLIRGGICCGNIIAESDYLFGEALIKSYVLESEYAIFPRLVIDRDLVDIPHQASLGINSEDIAVERGQDGVYYINYLYAGVVERLSSGPRDQALILLDEHRRAVEFMLDERIHIEDKKGKPKPTERIKQKYMWLALYHNNVVKRLLREGILQPMDATEIPPELLRF